MTDEQFRKHVVSLTVKKSEKPKKISERALRLWSEIASQHYNFERQEIEVAQLERITKEEVIKYYEVRRGVGNRACHEFKSLTINH